MALIKVQSGVGEIISGRSITTVKWNIKNYFELTQEVDYYFESPEFHFVDATWCMWLYPKGRTSDKTTGWLSLFLAKKGSISPKHYIYFRIGILREDGSRFYDCGLHYIFDKISNGYGPPRCLKASDLSQKRIEVAPDGVLTVFCNISVHIHKGVHHRAVQTETSLGVDKLVQDFKDLLISEEASDVTLVVKNREFKVHWAVLVGRSTVFCAMLKHDMREKNCGVVEINDCNPEAFQQFLLFLYSGNLDNFSLDTVCHLHYIADKYDAQELKESCVQFVKNNLSVETICDALYISFRHNETKLLEKAVVFFAKNMRSILVTSKWLAFVKDNPEEANDLLIRASDYNAKA